MSPQGKKFMKEKKFFPGDSMSALGKIITLRRKNLPMVSQSNGALPIVYHARTGCQGEKGNFRKPSESSCRLFSFLAAGPQNAGSQGAAVPQNSRPLFISCRTCPACDQDRTDSLPPARRGDSGGHRRGCSLPVPPAGPHSRDRPGWRPAPP